MTCDLQPDMSTGKALITGSTSGIGLAIAKRLAADGYGIVLNYAGNSDQADRAVSSIRSHTHHVILIRADVTDESDVKRLWDAAEASGPVDVLVNNVGDFLYKPWIETSFSEWNHILTSNLGSAFLCAREGARRMRKREAGRIVSIAAMNAEVFRAVPHTLPYAIAKAGLVYLTKTLAKTEGPYGIRVNAVCPGFVEGTPFPPASTEAAIPLKRLACPEEIADVVAYLVSEQASYVTGTVVHAHGGALL